MYFGKEEEVCNVTTHYRKKTVPWQPLAGHTVYLTRDSLLELHSLQSLKSLPSPKQPTQSFPTFVCSHLLHPYMAPSFVPPKLWGVASPFGFLKVLFGFPHRTAMELSHDISDNNINLARYNELERPECVAKALMSLSICPGSPCDMVDTNESVTNEYVPDSQSATVGSSDEEGHSQEDTDINMQLLQEVAALNGNFRFLRKLLDG